MTLSIENIRRHLANPQVWGFGVSVIVMALLSIAFFYPDAIEGNTLRQADMQQGIANGQEAALYAQATGDKALWTNALFSGMPTFQISPSYSSNSLFDWLNDVYGLWLPSPANLLFMMMMGMLILLYAMRLRWYYALLGAIAWGFSSYFVILIGAGHIWKFLALTYVPPTIAGLLLCYRGRLLAGAALTAVFAMLQINANHPQMTYYFGLLMAAIAIAYLVEALRSKQLRRWAIASAVALGAGLLAVGANIPSLYNTYEYSKETKRSQSELTSRTNAQAAAPTERPTGGLPKSDIVGWSYGRSETFSLLVPNIKGGATAHPDHGAMTYMSLDRLPDTEQYRETPTGYLLAYLPQYFNGSEGTNGPVYVGAVICALFLLGCIIVKGPLKWALATMTALSILLSWGANFESLTDLLIYHFPLYNKFRAVESILVIAQFAMPLLGIMALHQVFTTADAWRRYRTAFAIAFGVPALFCVLAAIAPGIYGDPISEQDLRTAGDLQQQVMQMAQEYGYSPAQAQSVIYEYSLTNPANKEVVTDLRLGMVKADGWRSLLFVALGAACVAACMMRKTKAATAALVLAAITAIDLYGADKRYVSHDSFVAASPGGIHDAFALDSIDLAIMADTAQSYRVMDVPGFTQARRSYYHKMIGGYHAAKLNRYEDLIQRHLSYIQYYGYDPALREDSIINQFGPDEREVVSAIAASYRVLDILNARYIITGDPEAPVMVNTHAQGNAWLADKIIYADNADAEMAALSTTDLRHDAVADRRFADILGSSAPASAGDTIYLTSYSPNTLTYHARTAADGRVAVFSEVYFPWGWHATIDGKPADIGRADYLLRAVKLPAGSHTITMTFAPKSLAMTSAVAYACIIMIYLLALVALAAKAGVLHRDKCHAAKKD